MNMNLYSTDDLKGVWLNGVAIAIAESKVQAKKLMNEAADKEPGMTGNVTVNKIKSLLHTLPKSIEPRAWILWNGDY